MGQEMNFLMQTGLDLFHMALVLMFVYSFVMLIVAAIQEARLAWKRHKTRQAEQEIEELRRRLGGAAYGLESDFQVSVRELQRLADLHRES